MKQIFGGIFAKQYEWETEPTYSFFECHPKTDHVKWLEDMQKHEYVFVRCCDIQFDELCHDDFVVRQVESLLKKKTALAETFAQQTRAVDDRIQNLLAISYTPTPAVQEPDDDIL
jgi:hypothetical protein